MPFLLPAHTEIGCAADDGTPWRWEPALAAENRLSRRRHGELRDTN